MPAADLVPLQSQQASQHTRTGEGELQVQPIQMPHDHEVGGRHWPRQIINAAAADPQNFRLLGDRQIVLTVDRFALSNPALVSAPSKKSFSSVSSPILACSDLTSTAGVAPDPKISEALASSCDFHVVIWLGWMSKCSASSSIKIRSNMMIKRLSINGSFALDEVPVGADHAVEMHKRVSHGKPFR
jgi:hypothetical protein